MAWMAWNARDDRRRAVRLLGAHGIVLGAVGVEAHALELRQVRPRRVVRPGAGDQRPRQRQRCWRTLPLHPRRNGSGRDHSRGLPATHSGRGRRVVAVAGHRRRLDRGPTRCPAIRPLLLLTGGLGDRVTVVSGLGGAAVLVGAVGWLVQRQRVLGAALAVLILAGAVGTRASFVRDYSVAAETPAGSLRTSGTGGRHRLTTASVRPVPGDEAQHRRLHRRQLGRSSGSTTPATSRQGSPSRQRRLLTIPEQERVDIVALSHLEATDRVQP